MRWREKHSQTEAEKQNLALQVASLELENQTLKEKIAALEEEKKEVPEQTEEKEEKQEEEKKEEESSPFFESCEQESLEL